MRHSNRRLTLFFITQVLAVAAMILVAFASRGQEGGGVVVVVSNVTILVELVMIAAVLSVNRAAWPPTLSVAAVLLSLGITQFVVRVVDDPDDFMVLCAWHLAAGLLLVGAVVLSGVLGLLAGRVRLGGGDYAAQPGDS